MRIIICLGILLSRLAMGIKKLNFKLSFYTGALAVFMAMALISCEKEITVDLPVVEPKIVVEGFIYQEQPPILMLTWSQGYFDPTNLETIQNMFVHDAVVSVTVDQVSYPLEEVCTADLSEEELELASIALGIPVESLQALDLCVYTSIELLGVNGKVYYLDVQHSGHHITGATKLPEIVELDTLFFDIVSSLPNDSLGFIYGNITDPDTIGNAYRWFAKRINHYPQWIEDEDLRGQQKDFGYIAPIGSVFDDEFFNGLSFEFAYYRGTAANSDKFDDLNNERGYFKRGDTIAVRGCTIDRNSYKFIYSFESQVSNQGSPFAVPFNLESNVEGGLGAFIGYGAIYDTVICQ
ncbi:MAG: DUF4249 domain-containing protein [Flavobacteriales bacterium]|nr:DUF4249 domain-containing protein [Flavobacteriales bacterium]